MLGSVPVEFGGEGRGGIAVHTGKLAEALTAAGESVVVLSTDAPRHPTVGDAPFRTVAYALPGKPEAVRLLLRRRFIGKPANLPREAGLGWRESTWVGPAAYKYWNLLAPLQPEIVHAHGAGLTSMAAQRAANRIESPFVLTVHSLRGHVTDDSLFRRSVPSLFVADAIITVSKHLRREAESYGVSAAKIHVIPNGVDRTVFSPLANGVARRQLGLPVDSKIVLLVAHLIERKGADIAIRAMRSVIAEHPSARLYLIGEAQDYTDPSWLRSLRQLPAELGLETCVTFAGHVPGHGDGKLNLWYNAADVVVLPSRAEGMGLVLIESMACGTPVIGARVGGIPDVISDGSTGLLVLPENPENLADGINALLGNADLRMRVTTNALAYVQAQHDWNVVARQTQQVYSDVLGAAKREGHRSAEHSLQSV